MSNWTREAKKVAAGRWIRFDAQNPQHTMIFTGEPTKVKKVSQLGPSKGEEYFQMSFPVLVDGEEKVLEPNRSLLTQLIEEDEEESIIGGEFLIKCLNPEKKTQWKIRRIQQKDTITAYEKKTPASNDTPAEEEEEEQEQVSQDEEKRKEKEKFMKEVEKRKKSKKKEANKETKEDNTKGENE